jgi:hypothetical protein
MYKNLKWWIFIFTFILLMSSCINRNKPRLIPKKELVDMMVNLNIYDALSMDSYITGQLGGLDSTDIYSSFFSKYRYNKEDFQYSLQYYSSKPKKLSAIYDAVFAELSKKSDEMKLLSESFSYSGLKNIWNYGIPAQKELGITPKPNHYDINIDSAGTYVITTRIKMTTEDQSINPRITAYYYDPKNDTEKNRHYFKNTKIIKSMFSREYQVYEKNTDPKFTHLHIILPDLDNKDTLYYKSMELTNFIVGVMRTDPEKSLKN